MTISAPIYSPAPTKRWKKESTRQLLAALEALLPDHMLEIEGFTDSALHMASKRHGYKIRTMKLGNGNYGVWRISP